MGLGSSIVGLIGNALNPIKETIDTLHTSEEEKKDLRLKMTQVENEITEKILDYEKQLLEERGKIVNSEIKGESWLQRNWRPILMLSVVAIIANNYILFPYLSQFWEGAKVLDLPNGLWTLLTTGVGGYVVGRSGEKITKDLKRKGSK